MITENEYRNYLNDLIISLDNYASDLYKAMVHFEKVTRPVYLMKTKSKQSRYVRVWRK